MIDIDIAVNAPQWGDKEHLHQNARTIIDMAVRMLDLPEFDSELSVVFTDDDEIAQINTAWRNKNKPTNVLSFPSIQLQIGEIPAALMGDIILSYNTIAAEAVQQDKSFDDHLAHMIVHGFLHLLGYDHQNDEEAEQMEQIEREILQGLAIADPYALSH